MGRTSRFLATAAAVATSCAGLVATAPPAVADGPGVGTPTVVTLGDSYISGEGGRWAGNTNTSSSNVDALGSTAYYDNASSTAETIAGCHRSKAAEAFIGGGVVGANLSCSGARTYTQTGGDFKPGIDFYDNGAGQQGQAKMLQTYAATHNVKMVVLSIGGNNFNFADIVQTCITNFLLSPSWWPNYCYDDSSVSSNFTTTNITNQTNAIKGAIQNVQSAMANAGYAQSQYTILVQNYMSPVPLGSGFRYSQSGYTRQSTGGCGFWNKDADWANNTAVVKINGAVASAAAQVGGNVKTMNLQTSFNGRRLCENTVGLLEEKGLATWQSTGAVDKTEWISQVRTVSTVFGPYQVQESLHPNYWGELALRNCVRQAYNGGTPRGGTCARGSLTGKNAQGEPNMTLT
ncbi:MAG: hypothetical protein FJW88_04630 [Actinobacteria bacterium]|nr:hypothetical protein [Actinomycetota bacterium]